MFEGNMHCRYYLKIACLTGSSSRDVSFFRQDWTLEYYLACGSEDALNREAFVGGTQIRDDCFSLT